MERRAVTRPRLRGLGLVLIAVGILLLAPAAALAVDGVQLYPPGIDAAYAWTSMENPDMSGPVLTFEIFGLSDPTSPPVVKSPTARIMFWNAANGFNRTIGSEVTGLPDGADQRHPTVIDRGGDVYIVWQQRDDPFTATRDIWLWRGDEDGNTDLGFPMLLIQGPAKSHQYAPEVGITETPSGGHLIVTWADDRDTAGATTAVYMLDLTANTDGDQNPNYLEPGFDPVYAGERVDRGGADLRGQHDPVVGAKGIFWLDDRGAAGSGESDVYRASLAGGSPAVSAFWHNDTGQVTITPRATSQGAAWLGPGIAGGPFEPWVERPGRSAGIITALANPQAFDVVGMRFAITGGHGGNTDGDHDIYFYDKATGQNVPVCDVGEAPGSKLKIQDMPTISSAPGGSRVVWADSRQFTNTKGTDPESLAYELYVALIPTVSVSATTTKLRLGTTLKLGSKVAPDFRGYEIKFQIGQRHSFEHPYLLGGKQIWYTDWTTVKAGELSNSSTVSVNWKPGAKGTYWVRAWFVGGEKYVDVQSAHRKVPHVPNASRVIRIVVL